ncbi:uncharacterized protein LOC128675199 [Plodia interpunctella]|uniref:uncharacterized protein LOC128675199 n=1 Tax=Plodia interpunctella TaxID=58824 RepID=UPI0023684121|nr:uncharacterized protein LOC128675199 [Plodia interpunctella]
MVIKVGINGFGRIGRVIFRTCHQNPDLEVTAINDPAIDVDYICYLIKFDSTHGKFRGSVTHTQNEIILDDIKIKIFHDKLPSVVPWHSADVQYVVESSGIFTSLQKASGHLASESVKRVIVTAPSADVPMVILGVNDNDISIGKKVISSASSTLYCLAPIVKILNDHYGVNEGFLTSIHAMTPSLKPLDGLCLRGKHWRDHRSILQNIIPATTGACKALGKIIPQVKDKLAGVAFRVPIVNVSVLDLTLRLDKETCIEEITKAVEAYSKASMANIVKVSNEEAVSSDFVGDQHSCILDVESSLQLKKNFFKLVCWYENEYSYACRVVDLIIFSENQHQLTNPRNKITFVRTRPIKKLVDEEIQSKIPTTMSSQITHNTSQISLRIRSQDLPVIVRSGPTQDMCNNDAIFRIWKDDEVKKHVIPKNTNNRSSDEILPPKQIDNVRAKQRLENVKKEFSKMVSITERLLSKCSKFREDEKTKANSINSADKNSSQQNTVDETPSLNKNLLTSDISDDVACNFENSKNYLSTETYSEINGHSSACNTSSSKQGSSYILNSINLSNSTNLAQMSEDAIQAKYNKKIMVDDIFQNQVAKTITNLIDGLSNVNIKDEAGDNMNIKQEAHLKQSFENKHDSGFVSPCKHKSDTYDEITSTKLAMTAITHVEVKHVEIEENTAFNSTSTQIENEEQTREENCQNAKVNSSEFNNFNTDCRTDVCVKNNVSTKIPSEILNSLNKYFDPLVIKADNSKCESSVMNTSITSETSRKMDIYDKLDSVSGSDSENSFQINERKSQIINITDLTNSIEDLGRLDKICRIIEISDDLSDRLFSALGSNENAAIQKSKWSFKDLCQKIKLDEFCNSLFAQSCHYEQKK